MKDLLMLLVITIVCKATASSSIKSVEWEDFKNRFGKIYDNEEEELFRLEIFNRNKQKMEKHNAEYEQGVHTFIMGMNQFSDMELHEFSLLMNGFNKSRGIAMLEDERKLFVSSPNIKLPQSVDWREKGAVTAVKDQGTSCGSCWAFSSTGALEGQVFRSTGKIISLSEQNLIDCSVDYGNDGCAGGLMDNAFEYVKYNGINPNMSYPYEEQEDICRFNVSDSVATVTAVVDIPQGKENALQEAVTTVGPISVAIDANHESFHYYEEGVFYEELCSTHLNHGVLVVGYGTDQKHGDYWIVKNSWGKNWGMDGYVKMARNRGNNCGIATMASYPEVPTLHN